MLVGQAGAPTFLRISLNTSTSDTMLHIQSLGMDGLGPERLKGLTLLLLLLLSQYLRTMRFGSPAKVLAE